MKWLVGVPMTSSCPRIRQVQTRGHPVHITCLARTHSTSSSFNRAPPILNTSAAARTPTSSALLVDADHYGYDYDDDDAHNRSIIRLRTEI